MSTDCSDFESTAVVGVLCVEQKLLVIKRSDQVIAPGKICFPGGRLESDETAVDALKREFREEVNLEIDPEAEIWTSVKPWKCKVHWWTVGCQQIETLTPDCKEVASAHWWTMEQVLASSELLESNRHFMESVLAGEISL